MKLEFTSYYDLRPGDCFYYHGLGQIIIDLVLAVAPDQELSGMMNFVRLTTFKSKKHPQNNKTIVVKDRLPSSDIAYAIASGGGQVGSWYRL